MDEESQASVEPRDLFLNVGKAVGGGLLGLVLGPVVGVDFGSIIGAGLGEGAGTILQQWMQRNRDDYHQILRDELFRDRAEAAVDAALRRKLERPEWLMIAVEAESQAAREPTRKRKEEIAKLIAYSVYTGELEDMQYKKLLSLLGELNNAQLIMLVGSAFDPYSGNTALIEYTERHSDVLTDDEVDHEASQAKREASAFRQAERNDLNRLGLTDDHGGATMLGRLLLRSIDQEPQNPQEPED